MPERMELPPQPHYFDPGHEAFRASLRAFVEREIAPHVNDWVAARRLGI